jgi:hypothetical protein
MKRKEHTRAIFDLPGHRVIRIAGSKFIRSCLFNAILIIFLLGPTFKVSSQTDWTKNAGNPILVPGPSGSWDSDAAEMGSVVFDGTMYHMWYGGQDGNAFRIGHATSTNGLLWNKEINNPVLDVGPPGSWDDVIVYVPCVILVGDTFHMWYDGFDGIIEQTGHATSTDGNVWIKDPLNPVLDVGPPGSWDDMQVFPMAGSVIFKDNVYHMWYGGYNGASFRIGYATSLDGTVWVKDMLNNPVMVNGSPGSWDSHSVIPGSVLLLDDTLRMWFSGQAGDDRWRVGYATSSDGVLWVKDSVNNPVLDYGEEWSWDNFAVWDASVIIDSIDQRYKMWYTGGMILFGSMGYAESDLGVGIDGQSWTNRDKTIVMLPNIPNPFTRYTTLSFELPELSDVEIRIYNQLGQFIKAITLAGRPRGRNTYELDGSYLNHGMYLLQVTAGNELACQKILKVAE